HAPLPAAGRLCAAQRGAERALLSRLCQDRSGSPGAEGDLLLSLHGEAFRGAAGHPGRSRGGPAPCLRRHHPGSQVPRRCQAGEARCRARHRRTDRSFPGRDVRDPQADRRARGASPRSRRKEVTSAAVDRRVRRWAEQRAAIDAEVRDEGVELAPKAAAGGLEAMAEFRLAARRMRGFDDIHREFAAQAERRAARAEACESAGRMESAREGHFLAALLWSAAIWPLFAVNETALAYERRMTQAYGRFAALMERPIERVEIPFGEKFLPAYLHLPHRPAPGERFAAILVIGGLDTNK